MKNSTIQKIIILFFLAFSYSLSNAQDEFMIYGLVQTFENSNEKIRLQVEIVEDYKTIIDKKIEADGQYRLDLTYGKTYIISFTQDGYTPMVFHAQLNMPEGTRQCCYRPLKLSFHLFKPDGQHDNLFKKTFHTIRYEKQHKGFNYDLDIDYMVQQRIVNSEIFQQQKSEAHQGNQARQDSVQQEKKYLALINQGTRFYSTHQFYTARKLFLEARKLKPQRMYPQYKIEDIRTELERFETKANLLGVNVDSIIQKELALAILTEEAPAYPPFVPLTKEQVEEIFRRDVQKQILASSESPEEANRTLAMMNEFFNEEFNPVQIVKEPSQAETVVAITEPEPVQETIDLTAPPTVITEPIQEEPVVITKPEPTPEPIITEPKQETIIKEEPKQIVKPTPQPKPATQTVSKVVNYETYQDSLRKKYTTVRTVEVTQNSYKKTTRVFLNNGKTIEVYAKVEHSWGATYYYLEEYPTGFQNIGYSAFMNKTKLYEIEEQNIQSE